MAGYFQKAEAWNYEGAFTAGEELENGVFVEITANGVKKITAAGDAKFRVDEKCLLWGKPAVRMTCIDEGTDVFYFTENEFELYGDKDYNESLYTVPTGHLVKMRRPVVNDMIVISVASATYSALEVGDIVNPVSGGSIAEYEAPTTGD